MGIIDANDGVASHATETRWLILNPTSGTADHRERVRRIASEREYRIEETTEAGHATALAKDAAKQGVSLLGVAGGDGTLHEVVQGLVEANALDDVTVGVVPTGTANIFARNIGVTDSDHGFELLETGETRRLDLGMADGEPFLISCIAGLTAEASVAATTELKEKLGSLAFLVTGIQEAMNFEGIQLAVTAVSRGKESMWSGKALCALVGNSRQFAQEGGQGNVEDGLYDITIVEQMPPSDQLTEVVAHRALGRETEHVTRMKASQIEITVLDGDGIIFSLDGEISRHKQLVLYVRPRALSVRVGESYDPDPTV